MVTQSEAQYLVFATIIQADTSRYASVKAYCLFVAGDSAIVDPAFDPQERFPSHSPPIVTGTQCGGRGGPQRDPSADTVSLHLELFDLRAKPISARLNYWRGTESAVGYQCEILKRRFSWMADCRPVWVS